MPRSNLNQHAVLTRALAMANNEGLEAVTVSSVARSLGVKPASLYSHVRDRTSLFSGMHRLALGELGEKAATAVAGRAGTDALISFAGTHRTFAIEHPGSWALLQQRAQIDVVESTEAARVASLSLAVLRGYSLPEAELVNAVRFVAATINGFLALARADAFSNRSDAEDVSWDSAISAIDRALRSWPREGLSL